MGFGRKGVGPGTGQFRPIRVGAQDSIVSRPQTGRKPGEPDRWTAADHHAPSQAQTSLASSHAEISTQFESYDESEKRLPFFWPFIKACFGASSMLLLLLSGHSTDSTGFLGLDLDHLSKKLMMTYSMSLTFLLPIYIFSTCFKELGVPRGMRDILTGGSFGGLFLINTELTISGMIGGWIFWRAQGYPGLPSDHRPKATSLLTKLRPGQW